MFFYHIWAWLPSCLMMQNCFNKLIIIMSSTEGPKCNMVKIGQAVLEKMFKDYKILYIYIAQELRQIIQEDKILTVTKRVYYFDHTTL